MARKRMLSPDIWESSSFSKLSDFAKLVFIGLISNADDSGKGKANPSYIRSRLFPNDEERRITDIKKALSEIALTMSIILYEVNGDSFYLLTNWARWQKIDRPTPSKIPDPPQSVGERGRTTQNADFDESSTNTRRILDEGSTPNRIEVEEEKNKNVVVAYGDLLSASEYEELCALIGKPDCDYYIERVKAFLKKKPKATFNTKAMILKWRREDVKSGNKGKVEKTYTSEQLNALTDNLSYEDL